MGSGDDLCKTTGMWRGVRNAYKGVVMDHTG